jgi:hypothetical protein
MLLYITKKFFFKIYVFQYKQIHYCFPPSNLIFRIIKDFWLINFLQTIVQLACINFKEINTMPLYL